MKKQNKQIAIILASVAALALVIRFCKTKQGKDDTNNGGRLINTDSGAQLMEDMFYESIGWDGPRPYSTTKAAHIVLENETSSKYPLQSDRYSYPTYQK